MCPMKKLGETGTDLSYVLKQTGDGSKHRDFLLFGVIPQQKVIVVAKRHQGILVQAG
jgi:hypothetical protein